MEALETSRLLIRNFRADDAPALHEMILQYSASEFAAFDHAWPTSEVEIQNVTRWFASGDIYLAICLKESTRLIGFIALNRVGNPDSRQYELGYCFNDHYHSRGYATEGCQAVINYAFTALSADLVTASTARANLPSCRLLARLGMEKISEQPAFFQRTDQGMPIEFSAWSFRLTRRDWELQVSRGVAH